MGPDVRNGSGKLAVLNLVPQRLAALLQPGIEVVQRCKRWHRLPQAVTRITHILLHLPLLPPGSRVAELGFKQEVADHGGKACIDVSVLALTDPIHGSANVVVDAPARYTTKHLKGVVVSVKQHLMGLQGVGTQIKSTAVAELEVGHLQLGAHTGDDGPVLGPVKLERLTAIE